MVGPGNHLKLVMKMVSDILNLLQLSASLFLSFFLLNVL